MGPRVRNAPLEGGTNGVQVAEVGSQGARGGLLLKFGAPKKRACAAYLFLPTEEMGLRKGPLKQPDLAFLSPIQILISDLTFGQKVTRGLGWGRGSGGALKLVVWEGQDPLPIS